MKKIFAMMKPFDYLLILFALAVSFVPFLITGWFYQDTVNDQPLQAVVKIHGQVVDEFILSKKAGHIEKRYEPNRDQYNIVEQVNEKIRVKEDNSPDQIAVKTGWISKPGQVSVCLPHHLIIEIKGSIDPDELILPFPEETIN
ncbi:NusG domain II-containing protein [Facklamia miroungae]|uniref:Uncharacterized protein n=1 Tax=Facklamia miroungae TaxID=120956 RepID=A0A1G7QHV0_9LACT|nr:NusG domain II-containing protein [Facklamia miroungae]NKZ28945.1 NusG domain II-containing protein [Facklamia miroungae]SDF98038.1 hypothetical protein SAMN05421791_10294 [Facklamia miroungae]